MFQTVCLKAGCALARLRALEAVVAAATVDHGVHREGLERSGKGLHFAEAVEFVDVTLRKGRRDSAGARTRKSAQKSSSILAVIASHTSVRWPVKKWCVGAHGSGA